MEPLTHVPKALRERASNFVMLGYSRQVQQEIAQAEMEDWSAVDNVRWGVDWAMHDNLRPQLRSLLLSQRTVYGLRSAAQFDEDTRLFLDKN